MEVKMNKYLKEFLVFFIIATIFFTVGFFTGYSNGYESSNKEINDKILGIVETSALHFKDIGISILLDIKYSNETETINWAKENNYSIVWTTTIEDYRWSKRENIKIITINNSIPMWYENISGTFTTTNYTKWAGLVADFLNSSDVHIMTKCSNENHGIMELVIECLSYNNISYELLEIQHNEWFVANKSNDAKEVETVAGDKK